MEVNSLDWNRLPNTFLIGAAKCGTTTLTDTLKQHPQVYLPFAKEPRFFSDDRLFYDKGINWYSDTYFSPKQISTIRIDASTTYLYWSMKAAQHIKDTFQGQKLRFIAIFRDPVERAYSYYWHSLRYEREDLPFFDAIIKEEERIQQNWDNLFYCGRQDFGYVRGGFYAKNLEPFLKRFPREDFLFLLQEDLADSFETTIDNLLSFLEIEKITLNKVISNKAGLPIHKGLNRFLLKPKGILRGILRQFTKFTPTSRRHQIKRMIMNFNIRRFNYPPTYAKRG